MVNGGRTAFVSAPLLTTLEGAGAMVLGPVAHVQHAMQVLHEPVLSIDSAIIDVHLHGETVFGAAEILLVRRITFIFVTHDQEEALTMSDRIAVMNKGVIQQIGTPHHIYSRPANVFVATFIGHSNLFHATLSKKDGRTELCFPSGYRLPMTTLSDECTDGQEVVVGIRPEEFSVSSEGLTCDVLNRTFHGSM